MKKLFFLLFGGLAAIVVTAIALNVNIARSNNSSDIFLANVEALALWEYIGLENCPCNYWDGHWCCDFILLFDDGAWFPMSAGYGR